jgi:hypothetical protein
MDEDYLRSIRRWLCADPAVSRREPVVGQEPEPAQVWIPLPRTPLE